MKHIVSFSGGRTSAYLVYLMEKKRIKEDWDVEYVFMDTGAEHEGTYKFIRDCVDYFNINLTVLKIEVNPELGQGNSFSIHDVGSIGWDLSRFKHLVAKYGNPYNPSGGYCTDQLKTQTYKKYIKSMFSDEEITSWIGIRQDEKRRLKTKDGVKYLAEISRKDKEDVIDWWSGMHFDLDVPEFSGNCVFCIKKSPGRIALAQRESPEYYKEWNEMIKGANPKDRKFAVDEIYRGSISFDGVAKFYSDMPTEHILKSIRRSKGGDEGCGSNSCEAFGDQVDMFNEYD